MQLWAEGTGGANVLRLNKLKVEVASVVGVK